MKYLFDRQIAWEIVQVLVQENGVDAVERNKGIGPKDEEWLTMAGQNGWIVITFDHRILSRKLQKKALRDHQVTAFFCAKEMNRRLARNRLQWFQEHWKAIDQTARRAAPGEVFTVSFKGRISRWKNTESP